MNLAANAALNAALERGITQTTSTPFRIERHVPVGGGCIHQAYRLEGLGQRYFLKLNAPTRLPLFEAEAEDIQAIAAAECVRVPHPIAWGCDGGRAWLILEHLDLSGASGGAPLGERLAALHRSRADRFGRHRDNHIGTTPQPNAWTADWVEFLRTQRIGYQLQLARKDGLSHAVLDKGERLLADLPAFFQDYRPEPSLIHGDLWGGNQAETANGEPVLFDPAAHYADREADLAMTELFGGFGPNFYAAYRAAWPLDPGYGARKPIYQLYHILNHHHLFGGGYARQAEALLDRLRAEQ